MFRKTSILLWVFLILLPIGFLQAQTREVGRVVETEGIVEVLRGGKLPAQPLKKGDPIYEKDMIRTKSNSKAEIALKDGDVIKISQRSRVDISEYSEKDGKSVQLGLPRGTIRAVVSQETSRRIVSDPKANKFEIRTPVAVAGVRGTDFFVSHRGIATTIVVEKGLVQVYNPKIPEVVVSVEAGKKTVVVENKPPTPPLTVPENERKKLEIDTTVGGGVSVEPTEGASAQQLAIETVPVTPPQAPPTIEMAITKTPETTPPLTEEINLNIQPPGFSSAVGVLPIGGLLKYSVDNFVSNSISNMVGYISGSQELWTGGFKSFNMLGRYDKSGGYTEDIFNLYIVSHHPDGNNPTNNIGNQTLTRTGDLESDGTNMVGYWGSISGVSFRHEGGLFKASGYALFAKSNGAFGIMRMKDISGRFDYGTGNWYGDGSIGMFRLGNTTDFFITDPDTWQRLHNGAGGLIIVENLGAGVRPFSLLDDSGNDITGISGDSNFVFTKIYNAPIGLWTNNVSFDQFSTIISISTIISGATQFFGDYYNNPTNPTYIISTYTRSSLTVTNSGNHLELFAPTYGYFGRIDTSSPTTGILIGETIGQFDITDSMQSFLVQTGFWLETTKLLDMLCPSGSCATTISGLNPTQQALKDLGVPVVEVGRTSFTGSSGPITSFSINDMVFFANNAGEKALIWASSSVSGTYASDPTTPLITLSGSAGTINVIIKSWQSGNWMAEIYGSGINLGSSPNDNLEINGVGAGSYGGGNISGTAAGVVK